MLRIRENSLLQSANQPIGQSWAQNHAPNAKPPKPGSYSEFPSNRTATFGIGTRDVCIDENHGRPPYEVGGPFAKFRLVQPKYRTGDVTCFGRRKTQSFGSVVILPGDGSDWRLHYAGGFTLSLVGLPASATSLGGAENITKALETSPYVNPNNLEDLGARAYAALRPKVEKVNLLQAVAEAKDLPRMLKTTGKGFHELWQAVGGSNPAWRAHSIARNAADKWKMAPKGAADQFLNAAFGWQPFVNDIIGTCDTVLFASDHISSAERNNGRWMQRRFAEDVQVSDDLIYTNSGNTDNMCEPVLGTDYVTPFSGSLQVRRQRMTRIWYEGSFRYYRPEFDKDLKSGYPSLRKLRQMATLLGLNLNATTLYRVTPWTWLVDWFAGVGNNVQALEDLATNQVASRYMYLMRETYDRFEYRCVFSTYDGQTHDLKWYKSASMKRRVGASSPFGFSRPPGGLSPMQTGILAALGISHLG